MPRLPVTVYGLVLPMLAVLAFVPAAVMAQASAQPSVETIMYHLNRDHAALKARKSYVIGVQGAMLYHECPEAYEVDEAKRTGQDALLHRYELALRAAYEAAHKELTTKLPNDAVLKEIDAQIAERRNDEAVKIGQLVRSKGCDAASLQRIERYLDSVRLNDAHDAAKKQQEKSLEQESY